uniref:MULE transposase domain-containing protein n=1 Tax=Ditylenchus dipsaci TaxID=166011 RepID=A0A915EFV7_9BILA
MDWLEFHGEIAEEQMEEALQEVVVEQANHRITAFIERVAIQSEKEKDVLTYDGFLFWKAKLSVASDKMFWACIKEKLAATLGKHNHEKSAATIPLRQLKQEIKTAEAETMHHPIQIFNSAIVGLSQAVQSQTSSSASRKNVQRIRTRVNQMPAAANRINFAIPEQYRHYRFGAEEQELFLLGDSQDAERILLFGRERNKNWSSRMKVVFMDGTFKITPMPFIQVYIILAERDGFVFPVLYALLPTKSQVVYEKLLQMVRDMWPDFQPSSVSADYERAVVNARNLRTRSRTCMKGLSIGCIVRATMLKPQITESNASLMSAIQEFGASSTVSEMFSKAETTNSSIGKPES